MLKIHENIRKLRLEKGYNQKDLADKMGVTVTAVSNWENGNRIPETVTLDKLADIFNCTTDYLLGRTEHRDSKIYSGMKDGNIIEIEIHKSYPHNLKPNEVEKLIENLSAVGFDVEKLIKNIKD
ncbi:helix-turn-helix domain-containing protein [Cellulosilyticum sp. I15G10I2]|uniref:helix-turn-helix domain-containing protein n=1 Tax=Cellulosilyticum sp. I15G10I2 TaxID=1892843 RepID=UPI00085CB181|nr:helix-turn-helix domain-containing protein [Cellulosilyticum sp. I15G10I2]